MITICSICVFDVVDERTRERNQGRQPKLLRAALSADLNSILDSTRKLTMSKSITRGPCPTLCIGGILSYASIYLTCSMLPLMAGRQTSVWWRSPFTVCILTASSSWPPTSNRSGINDPTGRKTSLVQQLQVRTRLESAGSCVHKTPGKSRQ
jgi:hypothetical protein